MSWFAHRCWYCGHKSRDVDFLVSSAEYHGLRGESPYQCEDRDACQERRYLSRPWERSNVLRFTRGQVRTLNRAADEETA